MQRKGFTLIELMVIIVVVGILATIVSVGLAVYQKQARDTQRQTDVTAIAEALEAYYEQNGEYPSCATMTSTPDTIASQLKLDTAALQAPSSNADNSFICTSLSGSGSDQYAYVGDGSASCQSGDSCLEWTLQYRSEETGAVISIQSRHTTELATSGALQLTATTTGDTSIDLTWNAVPNAVSYRVERSLNASMSGSVTQTTTATSRTMSGLNAGTRYYFRVTPLQGAQAGVSGTANATTSVSPPTGSITTASSLQSSNTVARGTVSGAVCVSGTTPQYSIGYDSRNQNGAISLSYSSWGTATTRDISASQGYNYTFQTRVRCVGPDAMSSDVSSTQTSVTRPINQPAAPNFTGDTTMAAGYKYMMSWTDSCPAGTSLTTGAVRVYSGGFGGNTGNNVYPGGGATYAAPTPEWWYLGWAAGQYDVNVYYYSYYSCRTDFTTSAQSPTRTTGVYVYCESARRSYSASPRCDYYGQSSSSLPWGP